MSLIFLTRLLGRCSSIAVTTKSFWAMWGLLIATATWCLKMSGRCGLRFVYVFYCSWRAYTSNFKLLTNCLCCWNMFLTYIKFYPLHRYLRLVKEKRKLFQLTRIVLLARCSSEEIPWSLSSEILSDRYVSLLVFTEQYISVYLNLV